MNQIDIKFQELLSELKRKGIREIFCNIKEKYLSLPIEFQRALENYYKTFAYWGKLDSSMGEYESLYKRAISLKDHTDDYEWLYNKLSDYRSKKLLYAILNNWYKFDMETTKTSLEKNYQQYQDLDIIKPTNEEVIVDVGAYVGDSILSYIDNYGVDRYKKIYAYEITPQSIDILKNNTRYFPNIEIRQKAVLEKNDNAYINFSKENNSANMISETGEDVVEGVSLDTDITEPITMIKMDIEGAEIKALMGSQNHIKIEKPKLLISVYHNYEDLWKIPRLIDNLNPNYKFFLRCYGTEIFPTEIILYAIN